MSVVKNIGGGLEYLKRDSGLYGHEDGRRCREMPRPSCMKTVVKVMKTVIVEKNTASHGKKAFFQGEKPEFNTIDKRYASLLKKQYYTISVR